MLLFHGGQCLKQLKYPINPKYQNIVHQSWKQMCKPMHSLSLPVNILNNLINVVNSTSLSHLEKAPIAGNGKTLGRSSGVKFLAFWLLDLFLLFKQRLPSCNFSFCHSPLLCLYSWTAAAIQHQWSNQRSGKTHSQIQWSVSLPIICQRGIDTFWGEFFYSLGNPASGHNDTVR